MMTAKFLLPISLMIQSGQTPATSAQIPERFHGVWDDVGSDCSAQSDALLRISASEMVFYESVSKITAVKADGDAVTVTTLSSGEGETWEASYTLTVAGTAAGDRLSMKVVGSQWGPFERKRCS